MKTFTVTYVKNITFASQLMIKAESEEKARKFFEAYKPKATILGIREANFIDETEAAIKGMSILNATA